MADRRDARRRRPVAFGVPVGRPCAGSLVGGGCRCRGCYGGQLPRGVVVRAGGTAAGGGDRGDYPPGSTIYREGSSPRTLLVVCGLVRVYMSSPEGRQVTVRMRASATATAWNSSTASPRCTPSQRSTPLMAISWQSALAPGVRPHAIAAVGRKSDHAAEGRGHLPMAPLLSARLHLLVGAHTLPAPRTERSPRRLLSATGRTLGERGGPVWTG